MNAQTWKGFALTLSLVFLAYIVALASPAEAAVPDKPCDAVAIGVVDYNLLINQHPDTPQANQELEAESDRLNQEYSLQTPNLSYAELLRRSQLLQQRLEEKRQKLLAPIEAQIQTAAQAVAQELGLLIVLPKSALVCGGRDITGEVLMRLTDYRKLPPQ